MKRKARMSEIITPIAFQLGVGGFGGFAVGYALKKLSKLVLFVIGLFLLILIYLNVKGIIGINYAALWNALNSTLGSLSSTFSWFVSAVSVLPFAASFLAGFALGMKAG